MNLESIATHLSSKGCGTPAKTIFVTEMPTSCETGILLLHNYSGTPIDHYLPNYHQTEFRLVVRSASYSIGEKLAKKAIGSLDFQEEFTAGTMLVRQCLALNLPRPYRRSVAGYWEFEVDFLITFVETSP